MKKEEYLNILRNNPIFQTVLSKAASEEEKRAIQAYTEDFMMKFYKGIFEPVEKLKQNDPDSLKNIYTKAENELIKDSKE